LLQTRPRTRLGGSKMRVRNGHGSAESRGSQKPNLTKEPICYIHIAKRYPLLTIPLSPHRRAQFPLLSFPDLFKSISWGYLL